MGIFAKRSLGQNFLVNKGVLDKIVAAAELDKNDTVLEIGPGKGMLTEKLAETLRQNSGQEAGGVIAVEKDRRLIEELKEKFKNTTVKIVEGDILKFRPTTYNLQPSIYKVVGNIPYYLTSHLLKTVFENWPAPKLIVLMVQKEVAQRIMARPPPKNGKAVSKQARMNLLALSVQFYAEPKIISYVSKGSFRPMPKVDSAIIQLKPRRKPIVKSQEIREQFFKLIKTAFAGKRKQLKNTVGLELLKKSGIKPESRPEELSLEDWLKIVSEVY